MKVIIVAVLLVCACAQYNYNLCTTTTCADSEPCADAGYPTYAYPSDRSGYTCVAGKCVAPQCSPYTQNLFPLAFAPMNCPTVGQYCNSSSFQCVTPPAQPVPPVSEKPHPVIEINDFVSAGPAGYYCTADSQCMAGYCDTTNNKCVPQKAFSPTCPASCTTGSSQCLQGSCVSGSCIRTGFPKEKGGKCTSNYECFSNSCVGGVCSGTDCTTYACPEHYWCDYTRSGSDSWGTICHPDYDNFISDCNLDDNYAVRQNPTTVNCVPKKASGQTCEQDYECQYFCSGGTCTAYEKYEIPLGKSCGTGACLQGLVCSAGYKCIALGKEGDNCEYPTDCGSGLFCNTGKCAKPGKEGATCLSTYYCDTGLICNSTLKCAPPGGEGATCLSADSCAAGLICNSATLKCSNLGKEGESCNTQKECTTDLICNSATKKCAQLGEDGDPCFVSQECNTDYICMENATDSTRSCQKSPTIGKYCSWDAEGKHNCSYDWAEMCACYDGGPKCVLVTSETYLAKLEQYVPKPPVIPDEPETDYHDQIELIQLKMSSCYASAYNFDNNIIIPSALSASYAKHIIGCSPTVWWKNDRCKSIYAKISCCNMCAIDLAPFSYPNIDSSLKFYSDALGPITKLTCGDNPSIEFNADSCDGPTLLSWDDVESRYSCLSKTYSYGKIILTVTLGDNINPIQAKQILQGLINQQIVSEDLPLPYSTDLYINEDGNIEVTLIYVGAKSGDNASGVKDTLSSLTFTESVSNNIQGATVSTVSSETASSGARYFLSMIALIAFVLVGLLF